MAVAAAARAPDSRCARFAACARVVDGANFDRSPVCSVPELASVLIALAAAVSTCNGAGGSMHETDFDFWLNRRRSNGRGSVRMGRCEGDEPKGSLEE